MLSLLKRLSLTTLECLERPALHFWVRHLSPFLSLTLALACGRAAGPTVEPRKCVISSRSGLIIVITLEPVRRQLSPPYTPWAMEKSKKETNVESGRGTTERRVISEACASARIRCCFSRWVLASLVVIRFVHTRAETEQD
ncbi:hypothetical protein FA95DRAFT_668373 [Auriscalpium vulgare]|uniref:Uncharacterized protein n=1 Tax=Auriscalpium vulgare TaxID=40419 RepID=A0ACB8RDM9_9AGAM|nr:hypothetical protein FA95DRAFT_668373 [Auriscalpium vulgare]